MSFTIFSIALIMVFAVIAAIEIYQGLKKGFFKSAVAFGMALVCMLISVVLSPLLSELLVSSVLAQYDIDELCQMMHLKPDIAGELILPVTSLIASIVIFVVIFLLLLLLRSLLCFAAMNDEDYALAPGVKESEFSGRALYWLTLHRRLLGGILGGLSAVVIMMVITSPLMGVLTTADQLIGVANDFDERIWDRMALDREELGSVHVYAVDIPGNVFYEMGGKHMFAGVATTNYKGEEIHLQDEVDVLKQTLKDLNVLMVCLQNNAVASKDDIDTIYRLCDDIESMTLLETLVSDFVSQSARGWLDGKLVMGIEKPQVHPTFANVWDQTLQVCAQTSVAQSKKNAITLLRIYAILLESGLLDENISERALTQRLQQHDVVNRIQLELAANKSMAKLEKPFRQAMMKAYMDYIFSKEVYTDKAAMLEYSKLSNGISKALSDIQDRGYINHDRLVTAISSGVAPHLKEYGLNVSESMLTIFADAVVDELMQQSEEITPDDVKKFLASFR